MRQALAQPQRDFASIARLAGGARLQKAADIASSGLVFQTGRCVFAIRSQANPLGSYQVVIASDRMTCTCPDFPRAHANRTECKHILAVYLALEARDLQQAKARWDAFEAAMEREEVREELAEVPA